MIAALPDCLLPICLKDPSPGASRHPLPAVAGRGGRESAAPHSSLLPHGEKVPRRGRIRPLPTACCLCLLPTADCRLPTAYCLLPTPRLLPRLPHCLLPTAYCLLPTAYCLLPTALPLPTAYCLLPTAACHCLLPPAYCLLPPALLPTAWAAERCAGHRLDHPGSPALRVPHRDHAPIILALEIDGMSPLAPQIEAVDAQPGAGGRRRAAAPRR